MINEPKKYVTPEIAIALKELGFNYSCFAYYLRNQETGVISVNIPTRTLKFEENWNATLPTRVSAPLWMDAMDFLRDKHLLDIHVRVDCNVNEILGNTGVIHRLMATETPYIEVQGATIEEDFDYYKVLELTILQAIKLIKNGSKNQ